MRQRKAQSLLEYTLLFAAIVAVIVAVLFGQNGMGSRVQRSYNSVGAQMETSVTNLSGGLFNPAAQEAGGGNPQ